MVAQVERLTMQLAERQGADGRTPQGSPQHSPHNDTLRGEDSALVAMLQSDLDRISAERWGSWSPTFSLIILICFVNNTSTVS